MIDEYDRCCLGQQRQYPATAASGLATTTAVVHSAGNTSGLAASSPAPQAADDAASDAAAVSGLWRSAAAQEDELALVASRLWLPACHPDHRGRSLWGCKAMEKDRPA